MGGILFPMKTTYIYIVLVVLVIGGLVVVRQNSDGPTSNLTTKYDGFAECLGNAGAKFYGAFWCPHCKEQKDLFENSLKLPYIECSTPDRKAQTQICIEQKITGYPTWVFGDGTRADQVQPLSALAEKTGCELPAS